MRLIDFAARNISPSEIRSSGYDGVVAYVSESRPGAHFGAKPLRREYADALCAAGLQIVSNFQYGKHGESTSSDFTRGFDGGVADAQSAMRLHAAAGGPDCAPIFFSIDEDVDLTTWNELGVEWFRGINSVLGVHRTGIYGHARVCAWAIEDGVLGRSTTPGRYWVWQTRAWSYGMREPAAVLYQGVIDTPSNPAPRVDGMHVDANEVLADDFGQWSLERSIPASAKKLSGRMPRRTHPGYPGSAIAAGAADRHVALVQNRLNLVADSGLLVDGVFASLTGRAVTAFQKKHGLVDDGKVGPKTWAKLFSDRVAQPQTGQRTTAPRYWPLGIGRVVTSPFGWRDGERHTGIDFGRAGGSANMPVYACQAGTVIYAGAARGYGGPDPAGWLVIDSSDDQGSGCVEYGHIIREVARGDVVKAGQRIGRINPDSRTNGGVAPHLHLSVMPHEYNQQAKMGPAPWLRGASEPETHELAPNKSTRKRRATAKSVGNTDGVTAGRAAPT